MGLDVSAFGMATVRRAAWKHGSTEGDQRKRKQIMQI